MTSTALMPAAFLGHGNPMNALADNEYTRAWRRFGASCPSPRAVLMVSAHWFTNATAVTAMPQPPTIHDFYGFPDELNRYRYPAPGSIEVARQVAEVAKPDTVTLDGDSWGLDHGAWAVLTHVFPEANVPVVQLSINAGLSFEHHMDLARRLATLRGDGVVIMGSGNLVHNLRRVSWDQPDAAYDWARRFEARAREVMRSAPGDAARLAADADYPLAAPTPEHFIPLLYLAALADESGRQPDVLVEGFAYGSVSMTSYVLTPRSGPAPS